MKNISKENAASETGMSIENPLALLRIEVEKTFGRRVASSRECLMLAEDIHLKTSHLINFNTLRRFFGLVKSEYQVSRFTANILSAYCGFNSIDQLTEYKHTVRQVAPVATNHYMLNYLVTLFKKIAILNGNDEVFNSFIKLTFAYLSKDVKLIAELQKRICKTKNARNIYFERYINFDRLSSFYGEGLWHYLKSVTIPDKKIFGYSLLCLRYWLTGEKASLSHVFHNIRCIDFDNLKCPRLKATYISSQLFYADIYGLDTENILVKAYNAHTDISPEGRVTKACMSFEFTLSDSLVLTRHFEPALYYIDYTLKNYPDIHTPEEHHSYQKLLLLKAIALGRSNQKKEAKIVYRLIKPHKFHFLSIKLNTTLYLIITRLFKRNNRSIDLQLTKIIRETGFKGLQKIATILLCFSEYLNTLNFSDQITRLCLFDS